MFKPLTALALAGGAFIAAAPAAHADPITVGQWYTFGFGGLGSSIGNGTGFFLGANPASIAAPDAPFTFTLAGPGELLVSDGFIAGDQFEIFDFGVSIGSTSVPFGAGTCGSDITACFASPNISSGVFALAAGNYSITGTVIASFSGGAGFLLVRDVDVVPAPAAIALFGLGLLGLGFARRAR